MSYARFKKDESDVYIFGGEHNGQETLICCGCSLLPIGDLVYDIWMESWVPDGVWYTTQKYSEMIEHVKQHISEGDKIPEDTIQHLLRDKEKDGSDTVKPFIREEEVKNKQGKCTSCFKPIDPSLAKCDRCRYDHI